MPHFWDSKSLTSRVPREIFDAIIDYLVSDLPVLAACGLVCSSWLHRSRYHVFSTVYLRPWTVSAFIQLLRSPVYTFASCISHVEMDWSLQMPSSNINLTKPMSSLCDALTLAYHPCFAHVVSIRLRGIDWTAFSFPHQTTIRTRLAQFSAITRLEFDQVMFHDMREPIRITLSFPFLHHLSATNLTFSKFLEYAITSGPDFLLPPSLRELELGSGEEVPVFFRHLTAYSPLGIPALCTLIVHRVALIDLVSSSKVLSTLCFSLHHLHLGFSEYVSSGELARCISFSNLVQLRSISVGDCEEAPTVEDETVSESKSLGVAANFPFLLSLLCSDQLRYVGLRLHGRASLDPSRVEMCLDWRHLDSILTQPRFSALERVHLVLEYGTGYSGVMDKDTEIRARLPGLDRRAILQVSSKTESEGIPAGVDSYFRKLISIQE